MTDADRLALIRDGLARYEAPDIVVLRGICERIGYGRVAQLAEDWMEEQHPGYKAAADEVAAKRHRRRRRAERDTRERKGGAE